MEAIIRTNDSSLFHSLIDFLKTLHITIEAKEENKTKTEKLNGLNVPAYKCGGKVSDFKREDLYGSQL